MKEKKKASLYGATKTYKKGERLKKGFYVSKRATIVRVIDNKLFRGVVRVEDTAIDIEEGIHEVKLPKIPSNVIEEIYKFFKYAYDKFSGESIVLLWYNFKTDKWSIEVPEQTVSSATADYERDPNDEIDLRARGFTFAGTMHSHGNMTAFHSGTDDSDEFNFDGLHITMGRVDTTPEFACRFTMKDLEVKQEPEEVMDVPVFVSPVNETWKSKVKKYKYVTTKKIKGQNKLVDYYGHTIDGFGKPIEFSEDEHKFTTEEERELAKEEEEVLDWKDWDYMGKKLGKTRGAK